MRGLTSGPWTGCTSPYSTETWTLTLDELRALLAAIPSRPAMLAALGGAQFSDRKTDRALQLLRQAGLIHYVNHAWARTDLGDRELR